ncbi:exodeoxyribonuclease I [Sediminispirochaeta bajacaliforniensis]|uniref:exodeoxyribonuclease I n=1 Tax=Sediminispirochaeta bajacaliforniensis TaxID=148 RepID=UPI00035F9541|nr:exodeoxyribonuclease I [Sediminispirochaeta bajacaliforniensis]
MARSIYWYDLETFGTHPRLDRIAQFAGLRTDEALNELGEPLVLYCKITQDYVPDPKACLITGITPEETLRKGLSERRFIERINEEFMQPGSCVAGFNSIAFDDEFIRATLYRNLMDPFRREWAGGNSRWDLLDVLRAARDLRPQGMTWPEGENGRPTFRLEKLTEANALPHQNAHDALSDVRATIAMARLLREKQPKIFSYLYQGRIKDHARQLIDLHKRRPFLHTSAMLSNEYGYTSILAPVAPHPANQNAILCFDLRQDPEPLIERSVDELRRLIFAPSEELSLEESRIRLIPIHINRSPVLAPLSTLDPDTAKRLGLDVTLCGKRAAKLAEASLLTQKIMEVFRRDEAEIRRDPELEIYSGGFFSDADRQRMERFRELSPEAMLKRRGDFHDRRLPELAWRFVCRNHSEILDENERKKWKSFCAGRLLFPPERLINDFAFFKRKVKELSGDTNLPAGDKKIIKKLAEWATIIEVDVLSYEG